MKRIIFIIVFFILFFATAVAEANNSSGSLSVAVISETEVRIIAIVRGNEVVSLFRGEDKIAVLAPGESRLMIPNLIPSTGYTFFLKKEERILSSVTCRTKTAVETETKTEIDTETKEILEQEKAPEEESTESVFQKEIGVSKDIVFFPILENIFNFHKAENTQEERGDKSPEEPTEFELKLPIIPAEMTEKKYTERVEFREITDDRRLGQEVENTETQKIVTGLNERADIEELTEVEIEEVSTSSEITTKEALEDQEQQEAEEEPVEEVKTDEPIEEAKSEEAAKEETEEVKKTEEQVTVGEEEIEEDKEKEEDIEPAVSKMGIFPVLCSSAYYSSYYGMRKDPFTGEDAFHYGVDVGGAPSGTPVRATHGGEVVFADWRGNYGNKVKVLSVIEGQNFYIIYAHLNSINVGVGDKVSAGQIIGGIGSTGRATGPHLHYEVRDSGGNPLNPLREGFLPK